MPASPQRGRPTVRNGEEVVNAAPEPEESRRRVRGYDHARACAHAVPPTRSNGPRADQGLDELRLEARRGRALVEESREILVVVDERRPRRGREPPRARAASPGSPRARRRPRPSSGAPPSRCRTRSRAAGRRSSTAGRRRHGRLRGAPGRASPRRSLTSSARRSRALLALLRQRAPSGRGPARARRAGAGGGGADPRADRRHPVPLRARVRPRGRRARLDCALPILARWPRASPSRRRARA